MSHRNLIRAALVATSGLLFWGCASGQSPPAQANKGRLAPPAKSDPEPPSDATVEKLAEAHAHYSAGVIHEMNEEPEAALQEYYQAALGDPADEALTLDVARRFLQSKKPEKAIEVLNRSASRRDASGVIFARLGFAYGQVGKTSDAIAANKIAIKRSPREFVGYQNLFLNYVQTKQYQEAFKVLDEAARQQDVDVEFLVSLADLYASFATQFPAQKDAARAKALQVLNRAEKLNPSGPQMRLLLAEGFNSLGDYAKATQLYLELLKTLPDLPLIRERVRAKLTDIYLKTEDRKRAVEQLQAILRDDPMNSQAYYFLGTIALEDKKLPDAAEYFGRTITLKPDFAQAYYDLAIAQIQMNKAGEALATLNKARQRFTENYLLEFCSGMAYSGQKDYAEAIKHYTSAEIMAKATDPGRLTEYFYFQFGAAYERKGQYQDAEKQFQKCLQLKPDFAGALNYLGYMWAEHGMKLEQARELIEKAVKLEPKNAAYLDSMGWVLYKLSKPKEALDYLLKAVELSEEPDATVYDHLGDIYAALKQHDKAREAWQKSVSLEANDAVKKKLETEK
jgi:tetratricopeptide (TPR) repeat protein